MLASLLIVSISYAEAVRSLRQELSLVQRCSSAYAVQPRLKSLSHSATQTINNILGHAFGECLRDQMASLVMGLITAFIFPIIFISTGAEVTCDI